MCEGMNAKPLHILVFAHSATLSHGGGRSLHELLIELSTRNDIRLTVVTPGYGSFELAARKLGAVVLCLSDLVPEVCFESLLWCADEHHGFGWTVHPTRLMDCVAAISRSLEERPDVVYTNTTVCPLGAFVAARLETPHVWHLREFVDRDFGWTFYLGKPGTYGLIDTLSDEIIVNSEVLRQAVLPYLQENTISTVPNGPLADAWLKIEPPCTPEKDAPLRLCLVGTIAEHKGQIDAVEAVALLNRRNIPVELHLFGDAQPDYQAKLREAVKNHGIGNQVHFRGTTADPRQALLEGHIALVTSRLEAFGRVTVEAMATARPVIATNTGANPSIIDDGVTGILYDVGNAEHLASAIERIYHDPAAACQMATRARDQSLTHYTRIEYGRRIEQILRRAAATPERKRSIQALLPHLDTIAHGVCASISHGQIPALAKRTETLEKSWGIYLTRTIGRMLGLA
ncbi:glycosyltransferase family 4 protein [Bremerella cremea]